MAHVCIITPKYPTQLDIAAMAFVQQFAWALADAGVRCTVICPIPINKGWKYFRFQSSFIEKTAKGNKVEIRFPKYFNFGQIRIGNLSLGAITGNLFYSVTYRILKSLREKPDFLYGHFINPAGLTASRIGEAMHIPSFVAYGESAFWATDGLKMDAIKRNLSSITGVIAVSTKNKDELRTLNIVEEERITVCPNAIQPELFYPFDKSEARQRMGISNRDAFIVSFVGQFIHRKGIETLSKAISQTDGAYAMYAGKGALQPSKKKTLFCGVLPHDELPWFYNASDVFVLPTLNEGCSNAIIEAMACGLPIISSDLPFNYDILDESNAILIDPTDISQLTEAIERLRDDPALRERMGQASLEKARELTLDKRSERILDFMRISSEEKDHNE